VTKHTGKLHCALINARSLNSVHKQTELAYVIQKENFDIVAITETWLTSDVHDCEVTIEGYSVFRKDRCEVRASKGGGVLLYVKENICAFVHDDLNKLKSESLWIQLQLTPKSTLVVGVCYRSQTAKDEEVVDMFSTIELASKTQALILGDFNYPGIDWSTFSCETVAQPFLDLVQNCFLYQHVKTPTRGDNILDLVLSTELPMIEELQVQEPFSTSDHCLVSFDLVAKTELNESKRLQYQMHKADFKNMRQFLSEVNWTELLQNKDTNGMWDAFHAILETALKRFVPVVSISRKNRCMWMTQKTHKAIKDRNKRWKKYILSKDYDDYMKYTQSRNKAVKAVRKAKQKFERKLADKIKKEPRSFYAYVRSRSHTKDKVGPLRDENEHLIHEDKEIVDVLNSYFSSVFTEERKENMPEIKKAFLGGKNQELSNIRFTEEMVSSKIKNLNNNKAPGDDCFTPLLLKEIKDTICQPLTEIFKSSLSEGVVPLAWRQANVTPIFKKGSRQAPGNYRPISLTSHIGKLMESLLKDSIVEHLKNHKLINDSQHGFTSRRSCLTNLLTFLEVLTDYVDKGFPVDVIYLDFQKAFDKVPHNRLIKKVKAHGITGNVADWIEAWLKDRQQRVVLNGCKSQWNDVKSGVPQGSILGPLLFVIYINDIDEEIVSKLYKFADDTKILGVTATPEDVEIVRSDLHQLFRWSEEWQMLFNINKCGVLHFGHNNKKYDYTINSDKIETRQDERDLGVIIDNSLKSSKQCVKAYKAANATLGMIRRSFVTRDESTILQLYKSIVRPKIEYCIQAWRPYLKKDIDLLEKIQHRATKMISSLKDHSYEERLQILGLTTLETRRLRGDLIEVFKIFKGFDDVPWENFFKKSHTSLRGHSLKLFKKSVKLDIRKHFFSQRIIDEWNQLPKELIDSRTVSRFKHCLDIYLRKNRGLK
jgi:hypothetical protein